MEIGEDIPANWDKWEGRGKIYISRDMKTFKSGKASFKVASNSADAFGSGSQEIVNVPAGARFKISGFVKSEGKLKVNFAVQSLTEGRAVVDFVSIGTLADDADWREFSKVIVVPKGAARTQVVVQIEGDGSAWLDDVRVTEATASDGPVPLVLPAIEYAKQTDSLTRRGWGYRNSKDINNELTMFQQAVVTARQANNPRLLADALRFVGWTYGVLRRTDEAIAHQQEAIAIFQRLHDAPLEALTIMDTGWAYQFGGDSPNALRAFEKANLAYQRMGDKKGQIPTFYGIGEAYRYQFKFKEAIQAYTSALQIGRQIRDKEAESNSLFYIGMYTMADGRRQEAMQIVESLRNVWKDKSNSAGEIRAAELVWKLGKYKTAAKIYESALEIAQGLNDKDGQLKALGGLSRNYLFSGENQAGVEAANTGLRLAESLKNVTEAAWFRHQLGAFSQNFGDYSMAESNYKKALNTFQAQNDPYGALLVWGSLGNLYTDQGRFSEALDALTKSLLLAQGRVDAGAMELASLGRAYLVFGMPGAAIPYFESSSTTLGTGVYDRGNAGIFTCWGKALLNLNEPAKAMPLFSKAVETARQVEDRQAEATALAGQAAGFVLLGEFDNADNAYQSSLQLFQDSSNPAGEASVLSGLGELELRRGNADKAKAWLDQAIEKYKNIGDRIGLAQNCANLGNVYEMRGDLPGALRQYNEAVKLQEKVRGSFGAMTEAKTSFLSSNVEPYRRQMRVLLRQNRTEDMFSTTQQMKARALLDLMNNRQPGGIAAQIAGKMTPAEREKEARLRSDCANYNRQMIAEAVTNEEGSKGRYEQDKAALSKAEQELTIFLNGLYARYPKLATQRGARTATLADLAKALPADTALLEFLTLRVGLNPAHRTDETLLFVVTKDAMGKTNVVLHPIPVPQAELAERVSDLREACSSPDRPYLVKAKDMYNTLIAPAEKEIAGKKRLIVCPDGMLWDVPFAALSDQAGQSLWARYEITCAYSATSAMTSLNRPQSTVPASKRNLLVVADPDFGDATRFGGENSLAVATGTGDRPITIPDRFVGVESVTKTLIRGGMIAKLPGTLKEAKNIQEKFGSRATLFTGAEAQEAEFKQDAPRYAYLHLATHGFFNDASPLQSALILAKPSPGSTDDGFLTAREIFSLDLSQSELAVLSACNTARGEQRSGEGVIGLTWALFAAGCPSQIVSQWPVNDASTASLMTGFYARLSQGKGKAAALRESALALSKNEATKHPYYWSPFVLLGDGR